MANRQLALALVAAALFCAAPARAQQAAEKQEAEAQPRQKIAIGYLRRAENRPALSRLQTPAANDGEAGARIGVDDDAVTGEFLNQDFELVTKKLKPGENAASGFSELAGKGLKFILTDLPADALIEVADSPLAARTLIFNIGASDDVLREEKCRGNVVHVAPTRSMLADGLAQYLVWKQWRKWFLVLGSHPEDRLWAEALKHSATRFGAKIVEERVYEDRGGARRSDSGVTLVQKEMPAFTQGAAAHDVLVAADESAVFADYLPLSRLGSASCRRVRRSRPDLLGRRQRAMGRDPVAAEV